MYSIFLSERIQTFECQDCGEESMTVWGSVAKDDLSYAVYYAGLMIGHEQASVRLAISIGGWGIPHEDEENVPGRIWFNIEARPTSETYEMMVREPEESFYFGKRLLGKPMSRAEALASLLKNELFAVADFIVTNDPAVNSYLRGMEVSAEGRKGIDWKQ
jgi:hypothetical protein